MDGQLQTDSLVFYHQLLLKYHCLYKLGIEKDDMQKKLEVIET